MAIPLDGDGQDAAREFVTIRTRALLLPGCEQGAGADGPQGRTPCVHRVSVSPCRRAGALAGPDRTWRTSRTSDDCPERRVLVFLISVKLEDEL